MKNHKILNVQDLGDSFECIAPKSKEHLALYCAVVFNVRFPYPASNDKYCIENGHASPLDAMWAAYAELDDYSIWYAMRGTGKTYDLSLLSFLEAVFKPHCGTNILGGSLEQSTRAVVYLKQIWETWKQLPSVDRLEFRLQVTDVNDFENYKNCNSFEYITGPIANSLLGNKDVGGRGFRLSNGSWINALAASTKSVRGPHPQKLRLDEVDEMDKVIYDAAMGQPKTNFGISDNIIISSTLHNAFGLMSELIDDRENIGAKLYPWCVNEVMEPRGFWTIPEIERRKKQTTKAMWEAEYELKRPKLGDTIFDFQSIDRAYRRGMKDRFDNNLITEAGIDWGYTCTVVNNIQDTREIYKNIESHPFEYVELTERCRLIADICIDRKIVTIYADSNPKDSNITLQKTLLAKRTGTQLVPIAFNKWKNVGINVLRYLLERNLMNISDKECQDKMKKYHYKNVDLQTIDKIDDHYPDSLIAWAASKFRLLGIYADSLENKK